MIVTVLTLVVFLHLDGWMNSRSVLEVGVRGLVALERVSVGRSVCQSERVLLEVF